MQETSHDTAQKTILITGSTDGIGLESARDFYARGHRVVLHGRSAAKLQAAEQSLTSLGGSGRASSVLGDLSSLRQTTALAETVSERFERLDVLINNAGVYGTGGGTTEDDLDPRFAVNTIAPFLLTQRLLPLLGTTGRVINLSSAAQAPVDLGAMRRPIELSNHEAYSQSKLALTMWTRSLAERLGPQGPVMVAVNPGSLLGTKMVRSAFGTTGNDIQIGVDILRRAALSEEFATASGQYFDNDARRFAPPHPAGGDLERCNAVVEAIEEFIARRGL